MKKKLFFISDMHGDYDNTIRCLYNSGYDEKNENHLLVCLGDFTDRGTQSKELIEWLYKLDKEGKAVVLAGNHTKFLIDYLNGSSISPFNYYHNGVDETFASLLERTRPFESWAFIDMRLDVLNDSAFIHWLKVTKKEINDVYPWLLDWLKSLPRYFESKNYIGVHGAIDTSVEDWRKPKKELYQLKGWNALDFDDGNFIHENIENAKGKTVVAGHFHTYRLRDDYYDKEVNIDDMRNHAILDINDKNGHKIFIDGCTNYTLNVNVLVVEDELLEVDDVK